MVYPRAIAVPQRGNPGGPAIDAWRRKPNKPRRTRRGPGLCGTR